MIIARGMGRYHGLRGGARRGLGGIATGYPTYQAFVAAVCTPLAYDPALVQNCTAQWNADPTSCANIVCDASGKPAVSYMAYTTAKGQAAAAVGYNTPCGFVPTSPGAAPALNSCAPGTTNPAGALAPLYAPAPTPVQSSSAATAPGGTAAPAGSPTPVQTQAPPGPVDTSATPIVLASACGAGQSYVPPGQAYQYPPYAGQISSNGACETIPITGVAVPQDMTGTVAAPTAASVLSSIPLWGWGVAVLALVLVMGSGGKR